MYSIPISTSSPSLDQSSHTLPNFAHKNDPDYVFAIGESECLGRGWEGPKSVPPPPCPLRPSSVYLSPLPTLPSFDHFPPLPPPLIPPPHIYPSFVTRPSYVSHDVCKPVCPSPMSKHVSVSKHVRVLPIISKSVRRCPVNVSRVTNVSKYVRPSFMSNQILPMKKLNKVKPLKYEKCDYVHVPSSPVSVPVPRPVSRSVPRRVPHPVTHRVNRHVPRLKLHHPPPSPPPSPPPPPPSSISTTATTISTSISTFISKD